MTKGEFCKCADTLRKYSNWERMMYNWGIDFTNTPVNDLADTLHTVMCESDPNWSYDTKLGFDWVIEWCFNESPDLYATRHGREFHLETSADLYEFLVAMNELGWED